MFAIRVPAYRQRTGPVCVLLSLLVITNALAVDGSDDDEDCATMDDDDATFAVDAVAVDAVDVDPDDGAALAVVASNTNERTMMNTTGEREREEW